MQLKIKTYTAIKLHSTLSLLGTVANPALPEIVRMDLLRGMADDADVQEFVASLKEQLDEVTRAQREKMEAWMEEAELKPLNIKSPPRWNEYDAYLMTGAEYIEYDEWLERNPEQPTSASTLPLWDEFTAWAKETGSDLSYFQWHEIVKDSCFHIISCGYFVMIGRDGNDYWYEIVNPDGKVAIRSDRVRCDRTEEIDALIAIALREVEKLGGQG